MKKLVAFGMMIWLALPAHAQTNPPQAGFADLVEKLSPAVVNISTSQKVKSPQAMPFGMPFQDLPDSPEFEPFRQFFDRFGQMVPPQEREVTSLGSGFIIDAKGYVITNNHVVNEADEVSVTLPDNSKYKAEIVGRDPKTDLALLKIDAKSDLPFVVMGDSDAMRVGDWVIAIGNPFGLGGSVTQGIISARQRSINAGPFDDFLQTDAPINRGNSGGPLFNIKGEVIGVNSAIFSPSGGSVGIGFAIPTSMVKPIVEQLKAKGHVTRGWLGVKIQEVSEEVADSVGLAKPMGALVLDVTPDGPAAKAGLQPGDIITQFDGKDITQMRFLPRRVAEAPIGKTVPLTYWRKDSAKTTQVAIGQLADDEQAELAQRKPDGDKNAKKSAAPRVGGMALSALSPQLRAELRAPEKLQGVAVLDVENGSEAAKRGVRPGDIIRDVGGQPVSSVQEVEAAFARAKAAGRKFALVRIVRGKEEAFVTLPVGK